jgi:hypothetical protein
MQSSGPRSCFCSCCIVLIVVDTGLKVTGYLLIVAVVTHSCHPACAHDRYRTHCGEWHVRTACVYLHLDLVVRVSLCPRGV